MNGRWAFSPAYVVLSPGGIALASACMSIENCCFVFYSPVTFMNTSPFGYQGQAVWGPVSLVTDAKAGTPDLYKLLLEMLVNWIFLLE